MIAHGGLAPPAAGEADVIAGRAVAVGGRQASVTPCFTCHGIDGIGDGTGAFPRLAGQAGFYMYKQLIDYASGARPNHTMSPIAQEMTEQQMVDVAAYYASRTVPYFPPPDVAAAVLERGKAIAEGALDDAGVPACHWCHGENGTGNPPSFPYLAGQYAAYTALQFRFWKQDQRRNDPLDVMREIAKRLSDDDIRALALYFETLRPADALTIEQDYEQAAAD